MAGIYRCDAPGDKLHMGHKICGQETEVIPVFTTRLVEATKKNPQPKWRCVTHLKTTKVVSAMTGQRITKRG